MRHLPVLGLVLVVTAIAAGCSDADTTSSAGNDAGVTGSNTSGLTLYDRLGGKSGLEMFVGNVVNTKILTDADLKTYFFSQVAAPIPAGHPSATQITVCFARFVGTALGSDTYPGAAVPDTANTNTPSFTCRDMVSSHRPFLNIGSATFDKFVGYIAEALMPLVTANVTKAGQISQAEFDTLAGTLNGQKSSIVNPTAATGPAPFVAPK